MVGKQGETAQRWGGGRCSLVELKGGKGGGGDRAEGVKSVTGCQVGRDFKDHLAQPFNEGLG